MNTSSKSDRDRAIDENLRKVYEQTLDEGIPDRFKELLDQLKDQEANQGTSK